MPLLTAGKVIYAAVAVVVVAATVMLLMRYAEMREAMGFPVPVSLVLAALAVAIARVMIGRFLHRRA
ncbi:MAG: hypothetical protein ACP5FL_04245 [Thermoplasmatota archaeon]